MKHRARGGLLTGLPSLLFNTSQDYLPRGGGTIQNGLDLPTSNINQEDAPQTCLQTNLMGGAFFQLGSLYPDR